MSMSFKKRNSDGHPMAHCKLKYVQSVAKREILKLLEEVRMTEGPASVPGTTTTQDAPNKYPEQSPTRKDKPILIPVKPAERK